MTSFTVQDSSFAGSCGCVRHTRLLTRSRSRLCPANCGCLHGHASIRHAAWAMLAHWQRTQNRCRMVYTPGSQQLRTAKKKFIMGNLKYTASLNAPKPSTAQCQPSQTPNELAPEPGVFVAHQDPPNAVEDARIPPASLSTNAHSNMREEE